MLNIMTLNLITSTNFAYHTFPGVVFFVIFDHKIYECALSALHRAPIGYSNKASYNLLQSIGYALETVGNS